MAMVLTCLFSVPEAKGAARTKQKRQPHHPELPRPLPSPLQKKVIAQAETFMSQLDSPRASEQEDFNGKENEPGQGFRREKRRRGEVLQHTVARPSRSTRMSGRTANTVTTGDTRIRGKRYRKAAGGQHHEHIEPSAKDIFGEVSTYDPYAFE